MANKFVPLLIGMLCAGLQALEGQNIDSLERSLKTGKPDTNRVKAHTQLFLYYEFSDTAKAYTSLREALYLSQKLNFKRGEALSYMNMGFAKEDFGDYDKALMWYRRSKKTYEAMGDELGVTNCDNGIGNIYKSKSMFPEALALFEKSLSYYLKTNNQKGIPAMYNNMGTVYDAMGDYKKATESYIKALGYYEKSGFKQGMAAAYCNLGVIFQMQRNWEQAISYFNKSVAICREAGIKNYEGNNYNNLGDIYEVLGDPKKALMYHFKALDVRQEIGDKFGVGSSMGNIGGLYSDMDSLDKALRFLNEAERIYEELEAKKYYSMTVLRKAQLLMKLRKLPEAEKYVKSALTIAAEIGADEELSRGYHIASLLYENMGNPAKALQYSKLYIAMQDSVFNSENRKTVSELEKKYQSEKKDSEIALLNKDKALSQKEIERSRLIRNSLLAGVALVLLLLVVSIRAFLSKKKSNDIITQQKSEVEKQKQLADERREIVEEKQKEILDSIQYAKRIQQAMLTSESYFKEHFKAEHFILYQPKDIVSGDFYWAASTPLSHPTGIQKKFYIATADCTGHGVPGAFMSLLNISFLNESIMERGISNPAEVLNEQRKKIIKALNPTGTENSRDGMDCVLCAFDLQNNALEFAAANNPVWIIRNSGTLSLSVRAESRTGNAELLEFKPDKMSVGKGEDDARDFTLQRIQLQKGDLVYTFTDGLADQFGGPKGKKFMYRQLKQLLLTNHHLPLNQQRELISRAINNWKGTNEQVDDILLIGVRV
jgi:serine phosphatase RsbU (regulator of sigma subunit)